MRNTQNLSIIRSEPPPAIGDETTGLCRALPWALFRGCWRWVFPSFSMAVIHSSFSSTPAILPCVDAGGGGGRYCAALSAQWQTAL